MQLTQTQREILQKMGQGWELTLTSPTPGFYADWWLGNGDGWGSASRENIAVLEGKGAIQLAAPNRYALTPLGMAEARETNATDE